MSLLSGTYDIGSPNFVPYGKTYINFGMKIIVCDACKQLIKRPTWSRNGLDGNFAFGNAYFD